MRKVSLMYSLFFLSHEMIDMGLKIFFIFDLFDAIYEFIKIYIYCFLNALD